MSCLTLMWKCGTSSIKQEFKINYKVLEPYNFVMDLLRYLKF